MSNWLSLIGSRFSLDDSLVIAVVYNATGASPDGDRGMLVLNREMVATNITNDDRRNLLIRDAKSLLLQSKPWNDIAYPLGKVMSSENGECRVIYQYFEPLARQQWIREAQAKTQRGVNVWVAFKKGSNDDYSKVSILFDDGHRSIDTQLKTLLDSVSGETRRRLINNAIEVATASGTHASLIQAESEQLLLLPAQAPPHPVVLIGRHRAAIAAVRFLALLPISVNWYAEKFIDSDPSGELITRRLFGELAIDSFAATTVVVIMSGDHEHDLYFCEQALMQPMLKSIGCIGSSKKAQLLKQQLLDNGIPQSRVDELHIPVGLPEITGKHPSLIAASVVAQILILHQSKYDDHLTLLET